MAPSQYIIKGLYPDGCEFLVEVTCYSPTDAMILAQGALKSSTLRATWVVNPSTGDKIFFFSHDLVIK